MYNKCYDTIISANDKKILLTSLWFIHKWKMQVKLHVQYNESKPQVPMNESSQSFRGGRNFKNQV